MAGLWQGRDDHEPAERLGGRQARRAASRRAVLDPWLPGRAEGRFAPFLPFFWTIWSFSKNKQAAKSLLVHLSKPASIEKLVVASGGYDLPASKNFTTLKVWAEEGPPKGTLYHYPNPYNHQTLSIATSPAPPKIAQQIYAQATLTKMCLRYTRAKRWRRRSPGRKESVKALCGPEASRKRRGPA